MNYDYTLEDETVEEMYMNETLPVATERARLLMRLRKPKQSDYKEMEGHREVPPRRLTVR